MESMSRLRGNVRSIMATSEWIVVLLLVVTFVPLDAGASAENAVIRSPISIKVIAVMLSLLKSNFLLRSVTICPLVSSSHSIFPRASTQSKRSASVSLLKSSIPKPTAAAPAALIPWHVIWTGTNCDFQTDCHKCYH